MKRVRIMLEMDSEFVRLLKAETSLGQFGPLKDRHTPSQALAVVALAEACGALPEQVHLLTPIEWRPHLSAISESRHVEVVKP